MGWLHRLTDLYWLIIKLRLHELWLLLGHQLRKMVLLETLRLDDVERMLKMTQLVEPCRA